jgi:hypothetical protein
MVRGEGANSSCRTLRFMKIVLNQKLQTHVEEFVGELDRKIKMPFKIG